MMEKERSELSISRKAIRRSVTCQASRSLLTLVTAILGLLLLIVGLFFGGGLLSSVIGGVLFPSGFIANTVFRASHFAKQYVGEVAKSLERKRQRRLGEIRADLFDLANELPATDEAGDLAAAALEQFGRIHKKFDVFSAVLDRKLHPGELAHARYLGAADQFFAKVIEHLSTTADTLRVVSVANSPDERQHQIRTVEMLLKQNDAALAAFDKTTASLAEMQDIDASRSTDLQQIKDQLDVLAEQAERLGRA
jgi:hypothetical protein